jgi:2-dehydro-3-deoxy-D-gluconate 5-dehydrogenase
MHDSITTLFSLAGKNALVTGATRGHLFLPFPFFPFFSYPAGIGAACAIALADAGASVCLLQRPAQPGSTPDLSTLNTITAKGGSAHVVYADLSDPDSVQDVFQIALQRMGGHIDILVNSAGIQRRSPAIQFPLQDWKSVNKKKTTLHSTNSFHF